VTDGWSRTIERRYRPHTLPRCMLVAADCALLLDQTFIAGLGSIYR
jgi:hypothetical protein